jgi:signal transduction histidine kinase/ActR/RegA family two-component response regulator
VAPELLGVKPPTRKPLDVTPEPAVIFDERIDQLLSTLERMAGGDLDRRAPVSDRHDTIDAIAHGLNVLAGELQYMSVNLRRALAEADAANRAKTTFLRNLSHEIRTPLSAMLALTQLLTAPGLSEARRDAIQRGMLSNGRTLLALVEDLLDLSKVEAGKLELDVHPVALLDTVTDVLCGLECEAERKGVRLSLEPVGPLPTQIVADRRRLRQMLVNVIGNAVKFTDQGQVRVRVEHAGPSEIVIDVIDTGIGISASDAKDLFAPFQQADPSIGRRFGGTGLGLALSKRLAEGMGGDVCLVESWPGKGTTFRVSLPVGTAAVSNTALGGLSDAPGNGGDKRAAVAGARVLVADDNDDLRQTLAEWLRLCGAHVAEAENGEIAVDKALAGNFEVIVMDVRMPVLDGLDAARRLRQAGCTVPIVALTADVVAEQVEECLAAGCDAFIPKPADLSLLFDAIARVWSAGRPFSARSSLSA